MADIDDVIDFDRLADELGGRIFRPNDESIVSWQILGSSQRAVDAVAVVTMAGDGRRRQVWTRREPIAFHAVKGLAEGLYRDNGREGVSSPLFPDDVVPARGSFDRAEIEGVAVYCHPVTVAMFRLPDVRIYVALIGDAPDGPALTEARGRLHLGSPKDRPGG